MIFQRSSLGKDESRAPPAPPVPPMALQQPTGDLSPLGEALKDRAGDVLIETVARTTGSEARQVVDAVVQESFERISISSTMAVARWIAGEGIEVAVDAGRETWEIFAELAVHHAASLDEVTRRCFAWRNVMAEVLHESAAQLDSSPEALSQALSILQLSLEFSIVRMCESFEIERRRLSFLATHDPLTGLPNRTLIVDRVEQMLARSARSKKPVTALFIDLDNFKSINDTLGHATGDELLQAVTARLRGVIRGADALGRLGGDEFVVISEVLSISMGPGLLAERVLDALKHPFNLGTDKQTRVTVTASIGLAVGDRISADELLRDADIAMYRAKWDGKSRYVVFEAGMQHAIQHRVTIDKPVDIGVGKKIPASVGKTAPRSYYQ
jgi:diguanylate cyclase (GGDEF)-like protein